MANNPSSEMCTAGEKNIEFSKHLTSTTLLYLKKIETYLRTLLFGEIYSHERSECGEKKFNLEQLKDLIFPFC
jgi:hypothetical protein